VRFAQRPNSLCRILLVRYWATLILGLLKFPLWHTCTDKNEMVPQFSVQIQNEALTPAFILWHTTCRQKCYSSVASLIHHLWVDRPIQKIMFGIIITTGCEGRSQWLRCIRRWSAAARLLRLWVRIPSGKWRFVRGECCVFSGRGICDELITRPEESYRLWCVVVCDLKTSWMRRP
jgi:hypothetical protein